MLFNLSNQLQMTDRYSRMYMYSYKSERTSATQLINFDRLFNLETTTAASKFLY